MERTFIFRNRQSVGTKQTPLGSFTEARYSGGDGGAIYLGLPAGEERTAVVFTHDGVPFYGLTKAIEPFGSNDVAQPHLKLTIEGEPLRNYN